MLHLLVRISKIFIWFLLFISFQAKAQWVHDLKLLQYDSDTLPLIRLDFDYAISSNAITNKFISAYAGNDFIDKDLKDDVFDRLKSRNRIGSELNTGIAYRSKTYHSKTKTDAASLQWTIALKHRVLFSSSFSDDLFGLYFYGNKKYENQNANINHFTFNYQQFQQLQLGAVSRSVKPIASYTSFFGLSFLNGQDYLAIQTDRGNLFTATDATAINLDLALTARQADTLSRKLGTMNGAGFSIDYGLRVDINKWKLSFQFSDLGFIGWNKKTSHINVDTTYHFEGVEVQNVLDSIYIEIKSDQEFKNGITGATEYKKFSQTLPLLFQLSAERLVFKEKIRAYSTLGYRVNTGMNPQLLLGVDYIFTPRFYTGIIIQLGGYSNLHAGLRAGLMMNKGWMFFAGTNYVDAVLIESNSGGIGGSVSVQKTF